jgi:hypothetical protein
MKGEGGPKISGPPSLFVWTPSERSAKLASDNNLAQVVFGKKEAITAKGLHHIFYLAIIVGVQHGIVACTLHFDNI